jgi:hypothetical protein
MTQKLLEKLFPHALVGQTLGNGVTEEVRVDPFVESGFFGHVFDDLLDATLRVVTSLSGPEQPPRFPIPYVEAKFVGQGREDRHVPGFVALRVSQADFQVAKRDVFNPNLYESAHAGTCLQERAHHEAGAAIPGIGRVEKRLLLFGREPLRGAASRTVRRLETHLLSGFLEEIRRLVVRVVASPKNLGDLSNVLPAVVVGHSRLLFRGRAVS